MYKVQTKYMQRYLSCDKQQMFSFSLYKSNSINRIRNFVQILKMIAITAEYSVYILV